MKNVNSFDDLYKVIQERLLKKPEGSYVASLAKREFPKKLEKKL